MHDERRRRPCLVPALVPALALALAGTDSLIYGRL
jgi:hypothetical protein